MSIEWRRSWPGKKKKMIFKKKNRIILVFRDYVHGVQNKVDIHVV